VLGTWTLSQPRAHCLLNLGVGPFGVITSQARAVQLDPGFEQVERTTEPLNHQPCLGLVHAVSLLKA
jgi:hypothetical protein